jgi:adenylate cyclase
MMLKGNATDWQTRIRLWAALTMATYAIFYNVYYALGLISIELMEGFRYFISSIWPVLWLLPVVILTHVTLGLFKLFKRNTLKMPLWEISQIILGTSIPFFLLPHIIYTYGLFLFFGVKINYADELIRTYPHFAWQYTAMTLAVWIHAQIGVHGVLRMRRWYPNIRYIIIIIFVLMPILGIISYFKGGLEVDRLLNNIDSVSNYITLHSPTPDQMSIMKFISYSVYIIFPVLYIFVLSARGVRLKIKNKTKNIILQYSSGAEVTVFPRTTILEASRIGNIPHASICGGRGRCTTCRVKVDQGMQNLSLISDREAKALKRIEASKDVRLACQTECKKDSISITLLLPPDVKSIRARKENKYSVGTEVQLVVMFADLRGFTTFSEKKFPYDVVFVLNRYFNYLGEVIEKNGGTIDKFLGDGILSFFGLNTNPKTACRQALTTAKQMAEKLIEINEQLKNALSEPLQIGIGIHFGEVILGEMGYKDKMTLTIIGDTVNTASRLEGLNKTAQSQLIFSSSVAEKGEIKLPELKKHNVVVRGKNEPLEIYIVKNIVKEIKEIY